MSRWSEVKSALVVCALAAGTLLTPTLSRSQTRPETDRRNTDIPQQFAGDYNRRLAELTKSLGQSPDASAAEYRVGANDLLEINVFEAQELNRKVRVSASGEISLPLLGTVQVGGMSAREVESALESRLHEYMKEPHVGVFVSTVESHPISVLGAVKKPGVFQVRGPKSVLEMLSLAEGLSDDAGDAVLVMRGAGLRSTANLGDSERPSVSGDAPKAEAQSDEPSVAPTVRVNLKNLLQSEDPRFNVTVYPGDIVKVIRAGLVYVVGEVKKPGGFPLKSDENMSVLKAIALAEGFTPTSKRSRARIIRPDLSTGQNQEIEINLAKVLAGKAPDPALRAADVVFVPNSNGKTVAYKGSEAAISTLISLFIWRW